MKSFYAGKSLFTWASAKVNRTITLMCKLRVHQDVDYNHLMIFGLSPKHIADILSQQKPSGDELAALVSREDKEKQQYDHHLSDDLLNHEYGCTYLDVDKAWSELQKLSTRFGSEDFYNDEDIEYDEEYYESYYEDADDYEVLDDDYYEDYEDDEAYEEVDDDAYEEVEQTSKKGDADRFFDFRHIRDISNVIKYNTLGEPLNKKILGYIHCADLSCEVETGAMFPDAPDYAMPINFLLRKGDKEVAILLVHRSKVKRYSVQETEALCSENGVKVMRFYFERENESKYVIERIKTALS